VDNTRLLLFIALSFVILLLWQAWQRDYGPQPLAPVAETAAPPAVRADDAPEIPDVPEHRPALAEAVAETPPHGTSAGAERISVRTDVLEVMISTEGGTLVRAALLDYPVSIDAPDSPLALLDDSEDLFFIVQGGLLGADSAPDHRNRFDAERTRYTLADGQDRLEVRLRARDTGELQVEKVFVFSRGSHAIEQRIEVRNTGAQPLTLRQYNQLQRRPPPKSRGFLYTFTGAAFSRPDKRFDKYDFGDLEDERVDYQATEGWVAMVQHYFVAAVIPPPEALSSYYSKALASGSFLAGVLGPPRTVGPGEHAAFTMTGYIGPKDQSVLEALAPGLDLTVDYGVLWFLAKPLFVILTWIHTVTGNWGWSIILLTVLVKALFFYPSAVGYRSMAKMRRVTPRLQAIRERHADDRTRQQQAMMELYKQEKINPLSGCLPILIQIPVFIALYWVLLESVELRQAPFVFWLRDLSTPDPYFALPLLMGVTMFLQQKLNPAPLDPVQQRVMQVLPVVFTIMFAWFPSGLVLYWTVSNILSIAQQWVITRRIEAGAPA